MPRKLDPGARRSSLILHRLLLLILTLGPSFTLAMAFHVIFFPDCPVYLTSLFIQGIPKSLALLRMVMVIPFALGYGVAVLGIGITLELHFQIMLAFIIFLTPIMSKDLRANLSYYRTSEQLRTLSNFVHEYRCLQIFHGIAMEIYGPLIIPFHSLASLLIVMGSSVLAAQRHELDWIIFLLILEVVLLTVVVWSGVLKFGGFYHKQWLKTVGSWKHFQWDKDDKNYLKKFTKSCRALQIGDQSRFKFNKLSVLCYIRALTKGIVRTLLTLRKR